MTKERTWPLHVSFFHTWQNTSTMVENVLEFYWRSHKIDFLNEGADNSGQQWQRMSPRRLRRFAGSLFAERQGSLDWWSRFFKHSLTEPGSLVNVGIETSLKAGRSRKENSVIGWRKRFISAFSLLGYDTTSIGWKIPKFQGKKCLHLHGSIHST